MHVSTGDRPADALERLPETTEIRYLYHHVRPYLDFFINFAFVLIFGSVGPNIFCINRRSSAWTLL